MKLTSALYVRNLIAKLHPPLPKSTRDSQHLLSILQSSFKRQLDDIHPSPRANEPLDASSHGPSVGRSSSAEATNQHLSSILGHPLLDHERVRRLPTNTASRNAVEIFDNALVHDKVDLQVIETCVKRYNQERKLSRGYETAEKLGSKIAAWFSSTTGAMREGFLTNLQLMRGTIPMMYQGGMEQVVWEWLRALYEGDFRSDNPGSQYNPGSREWLSIEDKFVATMMRESIRRNDIDGAANEYIQARTYRQTSARVPASTTSVQKVMSQTHLTVSWNNLIHAILWKRQKHGVTSLHYDQLLPLDSKEATGPRESLLYIYRPESATTVPLYTTLQSSKYRDRLVEWRTRSSPNFQKILLISILDAAELGLMEFSSERSRFFLDFAEAQFPTFISPNPDNNVATRIEAAREEVEVASLTDLLSVA